MHFLQQNFRFRQAFCGVVSHRTLCSLTHHFKLVVVGAGPGGLSVASRFCKKLSEGSVAVVEPNDVSCNFMSFSHFNQEI